MVLHVMDVHALAHISTYAIIWSHTPRHISRSGCTHACIGPRMHASDHACMHWTTHALMHLAHMQWYPADKALNEYGERPEYSKTGAL